MTIVHQKAGETNDAMESEDEAARGTFARKGH